MRKRLFSLLLAVCMIASVMANWTVAFAADTGDEKFVSIKYYTDMALTNEIDVKNGGKIENLGDEFYAALTLNNYKKMTDFVVSLAFDSSKVELLDYETGLEVCPVQADESVTILKGTDAKADKYMFFDDFGKLKATKNAEGMPKIELKEDRYVSPTEIKVGKESVVATFIWYSTDGGGKNITSESQPVVLRLKAKNKGMLNFRFPVKQGDDENTYYGDSKGITWKSTTLGEGDISGCTIDEDTLDILIVEDVPDQPAIGEITNLKATGRKVTWDAVSNAAGYDVKYSVNGGVSTTVHVNKAEFIIPNDVEYGDVTVKVTAISPNPEQYSDSAEASVTTKLTVTLSAPNKVTWDKEVSSVVNWEAVAGAVGYTVAIYENNATQPKKTYSVDEDVLTLDFVNDMSTPGVGLTNEYYVVVTAVGPEGFTEDGNYSKTTVTKKFRGPVADVTAANWIGDTYKATWTHPAPNTVAKYTVYIYKNDNKIAEITTTKTTDDFTGIVNANGAGKYSFAVAAQGAEVDGASYQPSNGWKTSDYQYNRQTLETITDVSWNGREFSWVDTNPSETVKGYQVVLYEKDSDEIVYQTPYGQVVTGTSFNFGEIQPTVITEGYYSASVKVIGINDLYENSEWSTKLDSPYLREALDTPQNLSMGNDKVARWDAVADATNGYVVQLYYNGVKLVGREYPAPTAEFNFSSCMKLPGRYTFSVRANRTDEKDASATAKLADEDGIDVDFPRENGTVYIEYLVNDEPVSTSNPIEVGKEFEAVISIENPTSMTDGEPYFDTIAVPFKFDPKFAKVATAQDGDFEELDGTYGVTAGEVLDDMSVIRAYVDNKKGLVVVTAFGDVSASAGKREILRIKLIANSYTQNTEFGFAVANNNNPVDPFDEEILSGFEFLYNNAYLFANVAKDSFAINPGKLAPMDAPVWNGSQITWDKYNSEHVIGYELELYKNGNLVGQFSVEDPDKEFLDLSAETRSRGKYTVRIRAISGDNNAISSDYSALSDEYKVGSQDGGGTTMGGTTPVKPPVEPDKPIVPVEPTEPPMEFNDIANHWAEADILELSKYGVLDGYGDGSFRPDWGITRAEFTKLMVGCLGLAEYKVAEPVVYEDTNNHWAKDVIAIGTAIGLVEGIGDNLFDPDAIITREQIATILHRAGGSVQDVAVSTYADREQVSGYAKLAVDYVTEKGYMIGMEEGDTVVFKGPRETTRAQVATILIRLFKADFFRNYNLK